MSLCDTFGLANIGVCLFYVCKGVTTASVSFAKIKVNTVLFATFDLNKRSWANWQELGNSLCIAVGEFGWQGISPY